VTARRATRAGTALLLLLALAAGASADGMTGAQKRGKRIYMEGKGREKITAFLAGAGISAPGKGFPCVNCHLAGGTGQQEGGVRSADISWFNLTKEYAGKRPTGRVHPAYTDETAMAAITKGVDPGGNALDPAHPRYRMGREDLEDLVAYLQVMDREPVPGVTDNEVRIGILLPGQGPVAEAGAEVRALLTGYFSEVNGRGGIFGRSLVLVPVSFDPASGDSALEGAKREVGGEEVFCFLANVGVAPGNPAARYLAAERVPVVVPLLSAVEGGYGADRYTFHVFAGIREQARVLADFLAGRSKAGGAKAGLLYARDPSGEGGAEGVREQAGKAGLTLVAEVSFEPGKLDAGGAARKLKESGADAVFYFGGPSEALAFAAESGRMGWKPWFLAAAPMVGNALQSSASPGFLEDAYLASPLAVPDAGSRQIAEFFRIGKAYGVGERHRTFQFLAYAGALLLEEGLKRAGRGVTRESFVAGIGNVWKLQTGVTPPLTYTANRRVGALGAMVVKVDPASRRLVPVTEWREPR
jgi:ABC-type branched-subunit amino acid transport system substrate-binding protein